MLPASGTIKLWGTTGDTNAVRIEIYGTGTPPSSLALTATAVKTLFAWVSGSIKLTDGYGKCYSYCACNTQCSCDANCGCDAGNCACDVCPAPEVPLLMADGSERAAGEIKVGDLILAWDETKQELLPRKVLSTRVATNFRMRVTLSNGRSGEFAVNHKFLMVDDTWRELRHIKAGEVLSTGVAVSETVVTGNGPVVAMVIDELHTYVTLGVVSHNMPKCVGL